MEQPARRFLVYIWRLGGFSDVGPHQRACIAGMRLGYASQTMLKTVSMGSLRIYDKDCDVGNHAKEYKPAKDFVWRKPKIEEEEGKLDDPMDEVVVYFFDEENSDNLEPLLADDRPYVPSRMR